MDNIERALREGGTDNAFTMGRDVGEVTAHAISSVVAVYGAPKACASLANLGLKVSTKAAKAIATLDTATIAVKSAQVAAMVGESARAVQQLGVSGVAKEAGKVAITVAKQAPGVALEVALQSTIGVSSEQFAHALMQLAAGPTVRPFNFQRVRQISEWNNAPKGVLGEALAAEKIHELIPGAKIISKPLKASEPGIDFVIKVQRNGVDHYIIGESKFGQSKLAQTKKSGQQMSDEWILGKIRKNGPTRLHAAVGEREAELIARAMKSDNVEKWLIQSNSFEHSWISLLDKEGKVLPAVKQVSKTIGDL